MKNEEYNESDKKESDNEDENTWYELIRNPEEFLFDEDNSARIVIDDDVLGKLPTGSHSMYMRAQGTNMEITSKQDENFGKIEVYWLPYNANQVTSVQMTELEDSKCLVFLTTTFTGCRFSITDKYVAHIPSTTKTSFEKAHEDNPDLSRQSPELAAISRDILELSISSDTEKHNQVRKTLTPTKLSKMNYRNKYTYQASDITESIENIVVIGLRSDFRKPFHFYGQKTNQSGEIIKLYDFDNSLSDQATTTATSTDSESESRVEKDKSTNVIEEKDDNIHGGIEKSHGKRHLQQAIPPKQIQKDYKERIKSKREETKNEDTPYSNNPSISRIAK